MRNADDPHPNIKFKAVRYLGSPHCFPPPRRVSFNTVHMRSSSVEAFWSRGAPSASLSPRYWHLGHEEPAAAACSPQTNAQYTGFHGEGGAFCHGVAGEVDVGNVLRLLLRSPSGTLDCSLLPTGFLSSEMVLNGQPLATTLLIRAISRAGAVWQRSSVMSTKRKLNTVY